MSDIKARPFFQQLCEVDEEIVNLTGDCTHCVISDCDATVGLTVDKHFVTITRHEYDSEDGLSKTYMSREAFDNLCKLYAVHKEVL